MCTGDVPNITCKIRPRIKRRICHDRRVNKHAFNARRRIGLGIFLWWCGGEEIWYFKFVSIRIYVYIDHQIITLSAPSALALFSLLAHFIFYFYHIRCNIFLLNQTVDVRNIIVCFGYTHVYMYIYIPLSLTNKITKGQQTYWTRFICFACT